MTREEIKLKLKERLTPKRYIHSLGVMDMAQKLAEKYGEDSEAAVMAGLLHDCARDIKGKAAFDECSKYGVQINNITRVQPELLHGALGAEIAREEYGVKDDSILRAIRYHTTGCENMSLLDKIIFLADCIEPNRNYPGLEELRKEAFRNLDSAMLLALDRTIKYVLTKGILIHPETIKARNYILLEDLKQTGRYPKEQDK